MSEFDAQAGRELAPEQELTRARSEADDQDVDEAVRELAGLVADADDLEDVLAHVAGLVVVAVPGADGAGVTVVRPGAGPPTVLAWAVTDPFVRQLDHLQYEVCAEGPCLTAMQTQRTLVSGSLGSDDRWRRFGGRAARLGVHSALSMPLLVRGAVVGALNIYAHERDAYNQHAVRMAEKFAVPAAVSVGNIQLLHAAHTRAAQLQAALTTRAIIDQAVGILRSRSGGTAEEAMQRLRHTSQTANVRLSVVAQRLVDEAVRRAHARHARPSDD